MVKKQKSFFSGAICADIGDDDNRKYPVFDTSSYGITRLLVSLFPDRSNCGWVSKHELKKAEK